MNVATIGPVPSPSTGSTSGADYDTGFVEKLDRLGGLPDALRSPTQNDDDSPDKSRIDVGQDSAGRPGEVDQAPAVDKSENGSDFGETAVAPIVDAVMASAPLDEAGPVRGEGDDLSSVLADGLEGDANVGVSIPPDVVTDGSADDTGAVATEVLEGEAPAASATDGSATSASAFRPDGGDLGPRTTHLQEPAGGAAPETLTDGEVDAPPNSPRPDGVVASASGEGQITEESPLAPAGTTTDSVPAEDASPQDLADTAESLMGPELGELTGVVVEPEAVDPLDAARLAGTGANSTSLDASTTGAGSAQSAGAQPWGQTGAVGTSTATATTAMVSAARVLDMLEVMALQPPPRTLTLDLTDLHGVRVTLALDGGGVNVSVSSSGAGDGNAREWARQLDQLLSDRDFGSDAGSRNQARQDRSVDGEQSTRVTVAPPLSTTQSTELRL